MIYIFNFNLLIKLAWLFLSLLFPRPHILVDSPDVTDARGDSDLTLGRKHSRPTLAQRCANAVDIVPALDNVWYAL